MTTKTKERMDEMIEIIRNNEELLIRIEDWIYDSNPGYVESNTEVLLYILRTSIINSDEQLRNLHLLDEIVRNIAERPMIHELVWGPVHDVFDDAISALSNKIFDLNKLLQE